MIPVLFLDWSCIFIHVLYEFISPSSDCYFSKFCIQVDENKTDSIVLWSILEKKIERIKLGAKRGCKNKNQQETQVARAGLHWCASCQIRTANKAARSTGCPCNVAHPRSLAKFWNPNCFFHYKRPWIGFLGYL